MKSSYIYITDAQGRKKTSGETATTASELTRRLRLDGLPHPVHVPDVETRSIQALDKQLAERERKDTRGGRRSSLPELAQAGGFGAEAAGDCVSPVA